MVKKEKTTKIVKKSRKKLLGKVVSNKIQNTITVRVEKKYSHPLYTKIITKHKKYLVHCTNKDIAIGDTVTIEEGKPMSKNKCFYFIEKVR